MATRVLADVCEAGAWTVFCHHGVGYAVDAWPTFSSQQKLDLMRGSVELGKGKLGPYVFPNLPQPSWPGFYWRCRWTGWVGSEPVERLTIPEIEDCMR